MNHQKRKEVMHQFNNDPSVTALLISLKAGGVVRCRTATTRTAHAHAHAPHAPRVRTRRVFSHPVGGLFFSLSLSLVKGLNLTVASVVFLMDPWWNPAGEEQAMDRVHRLGQTKDVKCVRFVIQVRTTRHDTHTTRTRHDTTNNTTRTRLRAFKFF